MRFLLKHKRICHLTTVHSPFDTRIFHKECRSLVKGGCDVILIAQHDRNEMVDEVRIIALPRAKNRIHRMFVLTLRIFWLALKHRANVYHFHDPELIPIGLLLKFLGKKVIYDVHEDYAKSILLSYYLPKYMRKVVAWLTNLIEKFSSRFFDNIVAATDDILRNFSYHKGALAIRNFPILSKFPEVKGNNIDRSGVFNLIYVGGLTPERGITEIVQAMGYLDSSKDIKLMLCGEFSPPSYEGKVRRLKGFKRVEYRGWVRPEEVWLNLTQADAGIVCFLPEPNHINAMPNKLFEYMAAGLPVIASNFPLWKEIIEGNNCGVCVDPTNLKEIAETIKHLHKNPDLRREMGESGRKAVTEKYNWENESKKLLKVYEELCEK